MNEKARVNYQGNLIHKVKIIGVRPNRLIVRLPNGKRGVIPQREWDWDQSMKRKPLEFSEGSWVSAILLPQKSGAKNVVLSIRELHNPWEGAKKRYAPGKPIIGEVVNLRRIAAFIQIEPGITAISWTRDIPLLTNQIPADVLVVGDQVRGEILSMDSENKRMEISLLGLLLQNQQPEQQSAKTLYDIFKPALQKLQKQVVTDINEEGPAPVSRYYQVPLLSRIRKILLIDDNPLHGEVVEQLLSTEFQIPVNWVVTGEKGLVLLRYDLAIDLAIVDLTLARQENGIDVARKIIQTKPDLPIIFISNNPSAEADIIQLEEDVNRIFTFVEKPTKEDNEDPVSHNLIQAIRNLQQGQIIKRMGITTRLDDDRFMARMEAGAIANLTLGEKLSQLLGDLARETQIDNVLLLVVHSEKKEVELLASHPSRKGKDFLRAMDGLYFSPVREVVENEEIFYLGSLDEDSQHLHIQNFFPDFSFRTCYCVPIKSSGSPVRYALFVLDQRADLSWNIIARIRATASFAALALEHDLLLNAIRIHQDRYLQGQLMGTFLHEFHNKLQPLLGFAEDGEMLLTQHQQEEFIRYFREMVPVIQQLGDLTRAYSRLAREDLESIDLNKVVKKVIQQLQPHAERYNIGISLQLESGLPAITAISLHIEQALHNIILNAIQNIVEQGEEFQRINRSHNYPPENQINTGRLVLIRTCTPKERERNACCIAVLDSGSGVPYDMQERIFYPNVTTRRDGQGLGLFISRNLVEAMHGHICLAGSIRFWGSCFALIFPAHKQKKNGKEY